MLISTYRIGHGPHGPEHQDRQLQSPPDGGRGECRASTVIQFEDEAFFIQTPDINLRLTADTLETSSMIILDCHEVEMTEDFVQARLDHFLACDSHVTSKKFFKSVLFNGCSLAGGVSREVISLLKTFGCDMLFTVSQHLALYEGPHFYNFAGIFRAFKLQADYQEAFILTTVTSPGEQDRYEPLAANIGGNHGLAVAVPSRLHCEASEDRPLAGLRIAVKDLLHLEGIPTGAGNRAYRSFYSAPTKSSRSVELAIRKGCVVLGKTKCVDFGGTQEVCGDWIDYSYALNCRGDGYLVSTGSSTGSAASLAAYDYLDATIGSDAAGSVRDPAVAAGLFGIRPTLDLPEEEESVTFPTPRFHRTGWFARDLSVLRKVLKHATVDIPLSSHAGKPVRRILSPSNYWVENAAAQRLFDTFVKALAKFANAEYSHAPISELWHDSKPAAIKDDFNCYLDKTFMTLVCYDFWKAGLAFRNDYRETVGRKPYVCPFTQWIWDFGEAQTEQQVDDAIGQQQVHNVWYTDHVLQADDTQGITFMVVPRYNSDHRDEYLGPPAERDVIEFDSNLHASLAGLPNLVLPIGQVPYVSERTGVVEQLPISASITAIKGMDLKIVEFMLDFLQHENRPSVVSTGRLAFREPEEADINHVG